uniref:Variant surface glycoprotein 1823 n=1 Tax=Trypanosoma brucei TaxID=5691 RepID=M4T149_9TRYP|nr:variant surface glycoprotein 1823 [Trypanosoma brucei]
MKPGNIAKSAVALAISMAAVFQLSTNRGSANGPDKGINRREFGLLCRAVVSSDNVKDLPQTGQGAKEAAKIAGHINLILGHYPAIQQLADTAKEERQTKPAEGELDQKCRGSARLQCIDAAAYLETLPEETQTALRRLASDKGSLRRNVNKTVEKLLAAAKKLAGDGGDTADKEKITTALKKAAYGGAGTDRVPKLLGAGSNRQAHCGTANSAGASATISVAATIACLCSSGSGDAGSNTGCYTAATETQAACLFRSKSLTEESMMALIVAKRVATVARL